LTFEFLIMNTIGVIGCKLSDEFFLAFNRHTRGMSIKKIFSADGVLPYSFRAQYPETEMVNDTNSIASDPSIELIILSESYLYLAKELISAGKHIRII